MKSKKTIALSAFAAMVGMGANACAHAQTSLQVTGLIDVYAGSLKRSGDTARTAAVNSNGMSTSYWGVKGVEDLGNGMKAQFNLTGFFRPDVGGAGRSNTDTLFARDANVGLAGSFGKISLGRDLAPNFIPSISLNPFGGVGPFSPLMAHTIVPSGAYVSQRWVPTLAGDTGWSNEVVYTTPDISGLTANLFYQFGEQAGDTSKNNVGANAMYRGGPLTLGAYFQRVQLNNPVDTTAGNSQVFSFQPYNFTTAAAYSLAPAARQNTWFLGGAYDFGVLKAFATYQRSAHKLSTAADDGRFDLGSDTLQLGLSAPVGNGQVMVSAARTEVKAEANYQAVFGSGDWRSEIKRSTVSVGYDHFLSKRTDVYTAVMHDKITDMRGETSFGVGVRHRF